MSCLYQTQYGDGLRPANSLAYAVSLHPVSNIAVRLPIVSVVPGGAGSYRLLSGLEPGLRGFDLVFARGCFCQCVLSIHI